MQLNLFKQCVPNILLSAVLSTTCIFIACTNNEPTYCSEDTTCTLINLNAGTPTQPFCHPVEHHCWEGCNNDDQCGDGWQCDDITKRCLEDKDSLLDVSEKTELESEPNVTLTTDANDTSYVPIEIPIETFFKPRCESNDCPKAGHLCTSHNDCGEDGLCDTVSEKKPFCVDKKNILALNEGDNLQTRLDEVFVSGDAQPEITHLAIYGDPISLYQDSPGSSQNGTVVAARRDTSPNRIKLVIIGMKPNRQTTIRVLPKDWAGSEKLGLNSKPELKNAAHLQLAGGVDYYIDNLQLIGSRGETDYILNPTKRTNDLRILLYAAANKRTIKTEPDQSSLDSVTEYPKIVIRNTDFIDATTTAIHLGNHGKGIFRNISIQRPGTNGIVAGQYAFVDIGNTTIEKAGKKYPTKLPSGVVMSDFSVGEFENLSIKDTLHSVGLIASTRSNVNISSSTFSGNRLGGILTGASAFMKLTDSVIEKNAVLGGLNEGWNVEGVQQIPYKAGIIVSPTDDLPNCISSQVTPETEVGCTINDSEKIPMPVCYDKDSGEVLENKGSVMRCTTMPALVVANTVIKNNTLGGIAVLGNIVNPQRVKNLEPVAAGIETYGQVQLKDSEIIDNGTVELLERVVSRDASGNPTAIDPYNTNGLILRDGSTADLKNTRIKNNKASSSTSQILELGNIQLTIDDTSEIMPAR